MIFDLLVCLFAFSYITSGSNTSCLNAFRFQPHSWPTMDLIFAFSRWLSKRETDLKKNIDMQKN